MKKILLLALVLSTIFTVSCSNSGSAGSGSNSSGVIPAPAMK